MQKSDRDPGHGGQNHDRHQRNEEDQEVEVTQSGPSPVIWGGRAIVSSTGAGRLTYVAGVFLQQCPAFVAELGLCILVEGRLGKRRLEYFGVRRVEGEAF